MTNHSYNNPRKLIEDPQINLLEIVKMLWSRKNILTGGLFSGACLGLLLAFLLPQEFSSSVTFIPQTTSKGGASGLGGLASLAGISLPGGGDSEEIGPDLYPKLADDIRFKRRLVQTHIHPERILDSVTFTQYFKEVHEPGALSILKKYTLGLPRVILKALKGKREEIQHAQNSSDLIFISEEEELSFELLKANLQITSDKKNATVQLTFTMPEAVLATEMALAAQQLLQEELIAFRIRNAQAQFEFTEKQYIEKQQEFNAIHARLAAFKDRNRNIASSFAESEEQKLEAEFSLKVAIFTEIAKQLEQARLQVKKDTPVFSTIQSATVPSEKSAPNRPMILTLCMLLGLVGSLAYIGINEVVKGLKEKWERIEK